MVTSNISSAVAPSTAPVTGKPDLLKAPPGEKFGNVLSEKIASPGAGENKLSGLNPAEGVKFSNHALERMSSRGISFKPDDILKLNQAVEKAAAKGSKEALVMMGENALIVSIKNRTVVTAMDREAMKENVFTNIDSTVIL